MSYATCVKLKLFDFPVPKNAGTSIRDCLFEIIDLAARHRLPAIYALRAFIEGDGPVSYAASLTDQWRRTARYLDRIPKGAKPGELPLEQRTTFEVWINAKAARTMGLAIPRSLLLGADEVIQ